MEPSLNPRPPQADLPSTTPVVTPPNYSEPPASQPVGPAIPPTKPRPVRHYPVSIMVAVVVVVTLLAGGVIYMFSASNKTKAPATNPTAQPSATPKKVTATDIDQTSNALDNDINSLNETSDANSQDLSDQSLSL